MKERVLLGMSGGVDSSASALILKNQGYEVIGVTIKLWDFKQEESCEKVCCSAEDVYDAKKVCDKLDIPHFTVNFKDEFYKNVIDDFLSEYNAGRTPSPCIYCNETIKFGSLLDFALSIDCKYIATGHYADINKIGDNYHLSKCIDTKKDQTYMLYRLSQKQLSHIIFPLSSYTKPEIRNLLEKNSIETFGKRDSQGICFVNGDYKKYILENISDVKPGLFTDINGEILGQHKGYQLYTIGQRRGLELKNSNPYFIIEIIPKENRIILGNFSSLIKKRIILEKIINHDIKSGENYSVRPRFSSKGLAANIFIDTNCIVAEYLTPNAENAPGQHAVIYRDNIVVGGGVISSVD